MYNLCLKWTNSYNPFHRTRTTQLLTQVRVPDPVKFIYDDPLGRMEMNPLPATCSLFIQRAFGPLHIHRHCVVEVPVPIPIFTSLCISCHGKGEHKCPSLPALSNPGTAPLRIDKKNLDQAKSQKKGLTMPPSVPGIPANSPTVAKTPGYVF
jgi:hypothetical protein